MSLFGSVVEEITELLIKVIKIVEMLCYIIHFNTFVSIGIKKYIIIINKKTVVLKYLRIYYIQSLIHVATKLMYLKMATLQWSVYRTEQNYRVHDNSAHSHVILMIKCANKNNIKWCTCFHIPLLWSGVGEYKYIRN